MKRRDFLKLMGLASSSTVLSACGVDKKAEKLIPYLVPPEDDTIPGVPVYYNTTCTECPANCGISVKVREELPVKLEGLSGHPINDGSLCIRGQASLTRLYHPDRIRSPLRRNTQGQFKPISWSDAYDQMMQTLGQGGQHLYLAGRTTGTLSELIDGFCDERNIERLPEFESYSYAAIKEANRLLFNQSVIPHYRIEDADFMLTLGADILETFVSPVSHATQLARAKKLGQFLWYHAEPHVSLTGLQATERLVIQPGSETHLLRFLLRYLLEHVDYARRLPDAVARAIPNVSGEEVSAQTGIPSEELNQLARQFAEAEKPLLIAGGISTGHTSGLEVAALAGLIQWMMRMTDIVVDFSRAENDANVGTMLDMGELSQRLQEGNVGVLFISRANPMPNVPASYGFKENLRKARLRVGLSDFLDDTMQACDIVLPLSHTLESWGDTQSRKGLRTVIQPALEPIFDTRTEGDILLQLMQRRTGNTGVQTFREYLFTRWREKYGEDSIESLLHKGYFEDSPSGEFVRLSGTAAAELLTTASDPVDFGKPLLIAIPSLRTFDGRSRVLPLLSEIPDPLTTISYGDWVSVSEQDLRSNQWQDLDEIELTIPGGSIRLPVKTQPGLPGGISTIHWDMLKPLMLQVDPRTGESICYMDGVQMVSRGVSVPIPYLSGSSSQEGRGIIPDMERGDEDHDRGGPGMYPEHEHTDYRWAMVIDLESCIGCSACVAACYIENNVAVVGPEEHLKGREMSWIRMEPYYEEDGSAEFLPMMCQHCYNAPCEPVCPVYATYHNPEGLNAQVYNRCVGTRYCANNCPYKVRRFNWFKHERPGPSDEIQMANPDVSIRGKGIMEKCTFCIQRIRAARDTAKDESRKIQDGEVVPACAQSCPTQAITFGNIEDKRSRVYQLAHSFRAYRVFEHLGMEPGVYYLGKSEARSQKSEVDRGHQEDSN